MAMNQTTNIDRVSVMTAEQLRTYVKSKGWFEDGKIRNVATIWHRHEIEDAEVLLPVESVKDYKQRVRDALSAIALFEKVSVDTVVNEVKQLFSNVISVRVIHPDTADGTIPINDGVLLITKAKDLILSAAQSMNTKKKRFAGKLAADVKTYLDSLLLGQTEVGSYVVNVIAPTEKSNQNEEDAEAENPVDQNLPLSKAITLNLVTSLQALGKASAEYEVHGELKSFDVAMLSGASANMCDALLGLSGEKRNRKFEITVTTSAGPLFESETRTFSFDDPQVQALEKATKYYKEDYTLKDKLLIGSIQKLSRPQGEVAGTVTLHAQVEGVDRNVQIELTGDDYHLAVIAHDNSELVRVQGEVHIKSKKSYLVNPVGFGVIRQDDLI